MGLNTYPSNPFPPSTDRMDADALEAEVSKLNSDVSELKSGLTNYEATTNAALALPDGTGKNIFPLSFAKLKAANALVSWSDNTYTFRGVTFTVTTNTSGYVTNINVSGTASAGDDCVFPLANADSPNPMEVGRYILSGCPATGGGTSTYRLRIGNVGSDNGSGLTFTVSAAGNKNPEIVVKAGYELPTGGVDFTPMIRPATITDPTFAPYIPSVESRIEAVESGLTNVTPDIKTVTASPDTNGFINLSTYGYSKNSHKYVNAVVVDNNYNIKMWKHSSYGWIVTLYTDETFTRVTDTTVSVDLVVFGIKA